MRRLLIVVAAALALTVCGTARAGLPKPDARAFYVVNASNGEVIAKHDADARVPIASITKLMTVIVALEHLKPDRRSSPSPRDAAQVGEERIPLFAGQQITVRDLLEGALIQSANNAADALAQRGLGRRRPEVRRVDERAREAPRPPRHAFRAARRPRRSRSRLERARRRSARAGCDASRASCARSCASAATRSKAATFVAAHLERPARRRFRGSSASRRDTRTRRAGARSPRCGDTATRSTPSSSAARTRSQRNDDLAAPARVGRGAVPHAHARRAQAVRVGGSAVRARGRAARRAVAARARASRRAAGRRADRRSDPRSRCPSAVARRSAASSSGRGQVLLGTRPLAGGANRTAAGSRGTATVVRAPGPCMIWLGLFS